MCFHLYFSLSSYVAWNVHELRPGQFTFSGTSDLPRFLSLAKEADFVVLLRLGPYICAEWEFVSCCAFFPTVLPYDIILSSSSSSLSSQAKCSRGSKLEIG